MRTKNIDYINVPPCLGELDAETVGFLFVITNNPYLKLNNKAELIRGNKKIKAEWTKYVKEGAEFGQRYVNDLYSADPLPARPALIKGKMKHSQYVRFVKYVYCVPQLSIEAFKSVANEVNIGSFFQNVIAKSTQQRNNAARYIPHLQFYINQYEQEKLILKIWQV